MEEERAASAPLRVRVVLEERDFVEATLANARARGDIAGMRHFDAFLLFVVVVAVAIAWPVTPGVWSLFALWLVVAIVSEGGRRRARARREHSRLAPHLRDYELVLEVGGYRRIAALSDTWIAWRGVEDVLETDTAFVPRVQGQVIDVLPKRSLDGPSLLATRAWLADRVALVPLSAALEERKSKDKGSVAFWLFAIAVAGVVYGLVRHP